MLCWVISNTLKSYKKISATGLARSDSIRKDVAFIRRTAQFLFTFMLRYSCRLDFVKKFTIFERVSRLGQGGARLSAVCRSRHGWRESLLGRTSTRGLLLPAMTRLIRTLRCGMKRQGGAQPKNSTISKCLPHACGGVSLFDILQAFFRWPSPRMWGCFPG